MKRLMTMAVAALVSTGIAMAQETPKWVRHNSISPDGKTLAFSYKGDIFTVPVQGGRAVRLTSNAAYESDPLWMSDNEHIIFSSMREGSKDVYLTSVNGGTPKRLTFYPGAEIPMAVLPDGGIVFQANIQPDDVWTGFPDTAQLWRTDTTASRPVPVTSLPIMNLSVAQDSSVLYEDYKGYEDPFRKHHTSSVTRDVWLYKPSAPAKGKPAGFSINGEGTFVKLTDFKGENRNPVFAADGDTYWYISEEGGSNLNLFRSSVSNPSLKKKITSYDKNPVRYLSVAQNGTVAYSYNGDLYVIKNGGQPELVEITLSTDADEKEVNKLSFSAGATATAISQDEKQLAVVLRGDVFATTADFKTTKRITNTAEQERDVCFSKDGRSVYYSSERNGCWGVWKATIENKDEKVFAYASKIKEELFSEEGVTSFQAEESPDGKWVAYYRNRTELVVRPSKGGPVKSLFKDVNYSYQDGDQGFEWSPDSHHILCNWEKDGGWNNSDIAVIDIDSGEITNLTRSGYSDGGFKWALGGKAMVWKSDKQGYRSHGSWGAETDVYIMFFDNEALAKWKMDKEDKELEKMLAGESDKKAKKDAKKDSVAKDKPKKIELNLDNLPDRTFRLTPSSSSYMDFCMDPDGHKLFYVAPLESGRGLLVRDLENGTVKVLERGVAGRLSVSSDGKSLYVASGSGVTKYPMTGGAGKKISFSGDYEYKPKAERTYIFDHVWRQVKEKFYDPELHGVDWDYYKENYAQFLPYINNYYDFQELLSEMLGELNGSHTGARYRPMGGESCAHFGVLFDMEYDGDGLKIKEILPGSVLATAYPDLKAGDIITSVNGQDIKAGEDYFRILAGQTGKKVAVAIKGKKTKDILVKLPTSDYTLLYKRWVRRNEELVSKLSGGKIGYVHVEGMNSASFREVYSNALGKYRTCDALIVDTRHNGGGWLHDDLATFLNGKAYIRFEPRGQYIGTEPYNKWCKPSCVLVCEDNYSDASGFPYVYKTLGIGKIIGTPVPGTMTAVWWENQVNRFVVFGIPQVGSLGLAEGRYLENLPVEPDILVYNDPAAVLQGKDPQLEAAVKEMLRQTQNK